MRIVRNTHVKDVRNPDLNKLLPQPYPARNTEGECVLLWSGDIYDTKIDDHEDCLVIRFEGWEVHIDRSEMSEVLGSIQQEHDRLTKE